MSQRAISGTRWPGSALLGAVGVSAGIGWLTLILVARVDAPQGYASFAVLWAMYYFLAGAISGLQQEVTRAAVTRDQHDPAHGISVRLLGLCIGLGFGAVIAATYAWWGPVVDASWIILLPTTLGAISLALWITALGVLAAQARWRAIATLFLGDALLRLGAVAAVGAFTDSTFWYAVAIVFGSLTWLPLFWLPSEAVSRSMLRERWDVRGSLGRSLIAMASTTCASLLLAGLPWLMAMTARGGDGALSGTLLAALVLFRSPVLVIIQGLRPVILRTLLDDEDGVGRHFWGAVAAYGAIAIAVTAGAYAAGPWTLSAAFGDGFRISSVQAAILAFSAVLLALATHLNLAFIAVDRHARATEGWIVAVATTILVLLLPMALTERLMFAAVLGPLAGVAVMAWAWTRQPAAVEIRVDHAPKA